eukprot:TRINITY_DN69_c0_g3_i1.p2 TRINITY_DN69_c0_g3~~TRINITY_DN69_c0_g3_i1.p2  ORF type:complete len:221 (+),score=50.14 TRINITY_DN69_c0_g3_i1:657-1319(+)
MLGFLLVVLACGVAAQPQKPVWPLEFDAPFGLNIPAVDVVLPHGIVNGSSHFYYNWDQANATLITYLDGCLPYIHKDSEKQPCNLTFVPAGTFFTSPTVPTCLWLDGIGSLPPNFLEGFTYSGFDQITVDLYSAAHFVHFWTGPGGFQYYTENNTGLDIALVDGGIIQWAFGTLTAAPQDPAMFAVPQDYKKCPFITDVNFGSRKFSDPYAKLSHLLSKK